MGHLGRKLAAVCALLVLAASVACESSSSVVYESSDTPDSFLGCMHEGQFYLPGEQTSCKGDPQCCAPCECREKSRAFGYATYKMACFAITSTGAKACRAAKLCFENGRIHTVGESFPSSDGCNTCTCRVGPLVECTKDPCDGGADADVRVGEAGGDGDVDASDGD